MEGVKNISGRKVQVSFANKRPIRRSTKRKKVDVDDDEGEKEFKTSTKKSKLDVSKAVTTTAHQKYGKIIFVMTVMCVLCSANEFDEFVKLNANHQHLPSPIHAGYDQCS